MSRFLLLVLALCSCASQRSMEVLNRLNLSSQLNTEIKAPAAIIFINDVFCGPCITEIAKKEGLETYAGPIVVVVLGEAKGVAKKQEIARKVLDFLSVENVRFEFVEGDLCQFTRHKLKIEQDPKIIFLHPPNPLPVVPRMRDVP